MTTRSKDTEIRRTLLTAAADLHVRETSDGDPGRTITGYAILFDTESDPLWSDEDSEGREIIDPAAVSRELLDASDIKFTMFHDRQLILARSNRGEGTLRYSIDSRGVAFEFEAPATADGDKALELVRRGDLSGCSFAFSTRYWDNGCVERSTAVVDGRTIVTCRVKVITGIYDFTLAADPAYPATSVEARELAAAVRETDTPLIPGHTQPGPSDQVREMRRAAGHRLL